MERRVIKIIKYRESTHDYIFFISRNIKIRKGAFFPDLSNNEHINSLKFNKTLYKGKINKPIGIEQKEYPIYFHINFNLLDKLKHIPAIGYLTDIKVISEIERLELGIEMLGEGF